MLGKPNPLLSSFKLSYYTLLNLLRRMEGTGASWQGRSQLLLCTVHLGLGDVVIGRIYVCPAAVQAPAWST